MISKRYAELPPLPDRIGRLEDLAVDLWWTWHPRAREVFRQLDYPLWRRTAHNPVRMLLRDPAGPARGGGSRTPEFLALYDAGDRGVSKRRASGPRTPGGAAGTPARHRALHRVLLRRVRAPPVAADLRGRPRRARRRPLQGGRATSACRWSASASCIPQGYFHQRVSAEGWQEESYERLNWADAPIEPALTPDGRPCMTAVPLGDRTVLVAVWRVRMGRVKLYLLDTDLEENAPWDRELSARLYGGDRETRIQQEIMLGIGGVRALRALGSHPAAYHLNEGHAAFVVLQRIRDLLERGVVVRRRRSQEVRADDGLHDAHAGGRPATTRSPSSLVEKHLAGCWGTLGEHRARFLSLGAHDTGAGGVPVQHDRARDATSGKRERRQPAARRRHARDVGAALARPERSRAAGRAPSPTACTSPRGSPPDLPALFDRHLGTGWLERHDDAALWDRRARTSPTRSCGRCARRCAATCSPSSRERARQRWTDEQDRRRDVSSRRGAARSRRPSPSASPAGSPPTSGPS